MGTRATISTNSFCGAGPYLRINPPRNRGYAAGFAPPDRPRLGGETNLRSAAQSATSDSDHEQSRPRPQKRRPATKKAAPGNPGAALILFGWLDGQGSYSCEPAPSPFFLLSPFFFLVDASTVEAVSGLAPTVILARIPTVMSASFALAPSTVMVASATL